MTSSQKTVLVTGATGRQGGATVQHLLRNGWHVKAMTRDINQPAAQALKQAGAEVIQGDYEDRASLEAAVQGVYGVFSVQAYGGGVEGGEIIQGQTIAELAKAAGVQHLVYSSVQSAADLARVGGDANKWAIEQFVRGLGIPYTILRPSLFMDDLLGPRYGTADDEFRIGFAPETPVGLIAAYDIGAFAAYAFEHPEETVGQTIEIASDILTPPQIAAAISHALGRRISYVQIPIEAIEFAPMARAFEYLNQVGYSTDLSTLRQYNPGLLSLDAWLAKFAVKPQSA